MLGTLDILDWPSDRIAEPSSSSLSCIRMRHPVPFKVWHAIGWDRLHEPISRAQQQGEFSRLRILLTQVTNGAAIIEHRQSVSSGLRWN